MPGGKGFQYTGQLGEVMQESALTALSYIRSQAETLDIDPALFESNDIHLHVPAGAVRKDGPSAGVTMAVALASLLTGRPVRSEVAMTGELTLRGQVLPVGGIKDKVLAAHRLGVTTIILPHRNENDLDDLPDEVRESLEFVLAERVDDVLAAALVLGMAGDVTRHLRYTISARPCAADARAGSRPGSLTHPSYCPNNQSEDAASSLTPAATRETNPLASRKKAQMNWYRADLHLHTPASDDYQESAISTLDILLRAESRGLDVIAFTDHNTIGGYAAMMREIEQLTWLEELGRAQDAEQRKLADYRRLLDKMLVLPGFEFTATLGFHIIGVFAPDTPVRQIEHALLSLNVPPAVLESGSSRVGASADVLSAYRVINDSGGICIAAHVNSTHGVAMRGVDFGGQTRIAYTQDPNLHALEVTDLTSKARGSTQRFFSGTKPEYPRRMRCIQGSGRASPGRGRRQ